MIKVFVLYVQGKVKGILTTQPKLKDWWDSCIEVLVPESDYMDCKLTVGTIEEYIKNNPSLIV
jgi:hypothetical protein